MYGLYNGIIICPRPKIVEYAIGAKHSAILPSKKKRIKKEKSSCLAGICQLLTRLVHHIAQLMNMLKLTLHFSIKDAKSVS